MCDCICNSKYHHLTEDWGQGNYDGSFRLRIFNTCVWGGGDHEILKNLEKPNSNNGIFL